MLLSGPRIEKIHMDPSNAVGQEDVSDEPVRITSNKPGVQWGMPAEPATKVIPAA